MDPNSGDLLLVAAGDPAALDRLVARWKAPVYGVFARTRDAAAAAEATADVFDRLRQRASEYDPKTPADAFLHRLVAERIGRDPAVPAPSIPIATLGTSAAARHAFLRAAVASLPDSERCAFLLTRVAGLSPEQAAEAMRTTPAEVQRLVVQSLGILRAALEPSAKLVPELGPVERHFGPEESAGVPADLDHRLAVRLHAPSAPANRLKNAALVGVGAGVVLVAAAFFLLRDPRRPVASQPAAAPAAASDEAVPTVPAILRVENAPMTIDTAPATEREEAQAAALYPLGFLQLVEALAALDPFFPEDVAAERAGPPAPRPTQPASSPQPPTDEVGDRIIYFRQNPQERARMAQLDRAFRDRPEAERVVLWQRWESVQGWAGDALGGLRPLGQRVAELPREERARLTEALRQARALPVEERLSRFHALPFARTLTGQEAAAADALLR